MSTRTCTRTDAHPLSECPNYPEIDENGTAWTKLDENIDGVIYEQAGAWYPVIAYRDGQEDGYIGKGDTKAEALADLLEREANAADDGFVPSMYGDTPEEQAYRAAYEAGSRAIEASKADQRADRRAKLESWLRDERINVEARAMFLRELAGLDYADRQAELRRNMAD